MKEPTKEQLAQLLRKHPSWGHAAVAAEHEIDRLREILTQISDPSYIGNYTARATIQVYRTWAKNGLTKGEYGPTTTSSESTQTTE